MSANAFGKRSCKGAHFVVGELKHPILQHQGVKLLAFQWNAGRKWRDVPVQMAVRLLTAERQNIDPLGRNDSLQCSRDALDERLKLQIGIARKLIGQVFLMRFGRYEGVSEQCRIFVQEDDCFVVFIDDMVGKVWIASDKFANETRL